MPHTAHAGKLGNRTIPFCRSFAPGNLEAEVLFDCNVVDGATPRIYKPSIKDIRPALPEEVSHIPTHMLAPTNRSDQAAVYVHTGVLFACSTLSSTLKLVS